MRKAMTLQAFDGDCCQRLANRSANEIAFTAFGSEGQGFSGIVPGAVGVRVLAPVGRSLQVVSVARDGDAFRALLARYDDEPPLPADVYLCSISAVVFQAGDEFTGAALATVRADDDLPTIPRSDVGQESS